MRWNIAYDYDYVDFHMVFGQTLSHLISMIPWVIIWNFLPPVPIFFLFSVTNLGFTDDDLFGFDSLHNLYADTDDSFDEVLVDVSEDDFECIT